MSQPCYVDVLLPVAVDQAYSYRVPAGFDLPVGACVRVPLGKREEVGVVWAVRAADDLDTDKLKDVLAREGLAILSDDMRRFVDWVADYTLALKGMVLRMVMRVGALQPEKLPTGVRASGTQPDRMTEPRARVLALAENGLAWSRSALATEAAVSPGVIDSLVKTGVLSPASLSPQPLHGAFDPDLPSAPLTETQTDVAEELAAMVTLGRFGVGLLDGVTGAGKTEVYFEAVAEALRHGRQVLILMPEIALTSQFLDRFAARFGARPAEWHSSLTAARKDAVWRQVDDGRVRVVVGARSALFLPFQALGLVIVDEEHDAAYKQEDRVTYHARDMAVVRGHLSGFPVILASATPSVESQVNARQGRYYRFQLPSRYTGAALPDIHTIDLRSDAPDKGCFLSPTLISAIRATCEKGEQSLLFLNRRGYAPLTLCRTCGHRFQCPNCTSWLVAHRQRHQLVCHHCGYACRQPKACPTCDGEDSLVACGPGVERIAEEVQERFPDKRVVLLSSDILTSVATMRAELEVVRRGEADIVIGTQVVAKGHNFPNMTLVGVVDADLGLGQGDPRAAERTFQLLQQVVGRAGRAGQKAMGLLQTYSPDHPVIQALVAGDRDLFYDREVTEREQVGLPPFGRLAGFVVSGRDRATVQDYARQVVRAAPRMEAVRLLGPAEAPLAYLRGRHRVRLLLKVPRTFDVQGYIRHWLAQLPPAQGGVRLQIDIDPQTFL